MLNRRHIRIKVMQSLYAFKGTESDDLSKDEKFLKCNSMGKILKCGLEFLTTNYENVNPLKIGQELIPVFIKT